MSDLDDISDSVGSEKRDDKDDDFNIADYQDEIDSDDFSEELPENNINNYRDVADEQVRRNSTEDNETTSPSGHCFSKKLVCIKYPGNVVNVNKAIETLGGISSISTAVDTPNRRLELRFRPNDGYSKPTCGDKHITAGFLLRIRVKKSRVKKAQGNETEKVHSGTEATTVSADTGKQTNRIDIDDLGGANSSAGTLGKTSTSKEMMDVDGSTVTRLAKQVEEFNMGSSKDDKDLSQKTEKSNSKDPNINLEKAENVFQYKKNLRPTFERGKYENLSYDADYELPKLKILGRVDIEFKFTSLCDYQYLPLTKKKDDPSVLECRYDSIFPRSVPPFSWLKNEVPYFLPPAAFSRINSIQLYVPKTETDSQSENVIGKTKIRSTGFFNYISFTTPDVPSTAPTGIGTAMRVKFLRKDVHLEKMRKLFEERPIWSKNAIMYITKFTSEQLKILLPSVAYYFKTGPWRVMWIRLGYDPRQDSSARKYQTLDYRLRAMYALGSSVKCKRNYSDYILPYKSTVFAKQKAPIITPTMNLDQGRKKEDNADDSVYIFREGTIPPSRQMFYQYCDIHIDEIQEMLAKLPDPLPGTKCHEKTGWLPSGFDVQCREIINKQVRNVLRKQHNIPLDHPTSLPRKRKYMQHFQKLRGKLAKKETTKVSLKRQLKKCLNIPEATEHNVVEEPMPGPSTREY